MGTTDTKVIAKALGEKWAAQTDKSPWERASEVEKARFEREQAVYMAALNAEADEEQRARDAAAAGPSDREVERAEKRARMEEESTARMAKPKAPRKARVQTAEEKLLDEQNKAVMGDAGKAAKQRLNFLLSQSDLFKHFGLKEETASEGKAKKGKRKTEREEVRAAAAFAHAPAAPRCSPALTRACSSAHARPRHARPPPPPSLHSELVRIPRSRLGCCAPLRTRR